MENCSPPLTSSKTQIAEPGVQKEKVECSLMKFDRGVDEDTPARRAICGDHNTQRRTFLMSTMTKEVLIMTVQHSDDVRGDELPTMSFHQPQPSSCQPSSSSGSFTPNTL